MKRSLRSRSQKRRHATRLGVQKLEQRQLMAADIGLVDGFVSINGTADNDVAAVYSESDSIIVKVATYDESGEQIGAASETYQQSEVNGIVFQAGDGDDLFVNDTNIDSITRSGGGNDTVMGGGGNDILAAGIGDDVVLGGGGDDIILAGPGDNVMIPALSDAAVDQTPATTDDTDLPADQPETPAADSAEDSSETEVSDTEATDKTPENVDPLTVEAEAIAENESSEEAVSTEEAMLELETETEVSDSDNVEPELLDIDDPVTQDSEIDPPSTDAVATCDADNALHDVDMPAEPVLVQTTADELVADSAVEVASEEAVGAEAELVPFDTTNPAESDAEATAEPTDDPEVLDTEEPGVSIDTDAEATDNDVIFGGEGDDIIFGEAGDDLIFGGNSAVDDALLRLVIAGRL